MSPTVFEHPSFSTARLDRAAEKRDDKLWIEQQHQHSHTLYVPLWRSRCLVQATDRGSEQTAYRALMLGREAIEPLAQSPHSPTLLGRHSGHTYFGVTVGDAMAKQLSEQHQAIFQDLRRVIDHLDTLDAGILAYAKALHYWQHRHTFCGVCGHANDLISAGHRMRCGNHECGRDTFPRIDPAIIVLVTHDNACLLGRHRSWPATRYSTLAGFVEPGESLEEAVAREVLEESSVELKSVRYRSSQPWPFPASAMAGFYAEAHSRHLRVDEDELEHAQWLTAAEIREQVEAGTLSLPTPYSIAFSLIAQWYQEQTGEDPMQLLQLHTQATSARPK